MSDFVISAENRTVVGKKVKNLRNAGKVPGVIYGDDMTGAPIQLETSELASVFRKGGRNDQLTVKLDGEEHMVIVRELQRHMTRGDLLHVDFLKVRKGQQIEMEMNFEIVGRSTPTSDGLGSDILVLSSVQIMTTPGNMISTLEVDVSSITAPDESITVADLKLPEGLTVLAEPTQTIAIFEYTAAEESLDSGDEVDPNAVEVLTEAEEEE